MKNILHILIVITLFAGFSMACNQGDIVHDATGTFEAIEIIVSSEANGKVLQLDIEEGDELEAEQQVAIIDGSMLLLQKEQILASADALKLKRADAQPQVEVLEEQLKSSYLDIATLESQLSVLTTEQQRINNLHMAEAATDQQKDEIDGKVDVLNNQITAARGKQTIIKTQIKATKDAVHIQNRAIGSERKPLEKTAAVIDHQISKTTLTNPVKGIVLTQYVYEGEYVNIGKPMYKLADLSEMTLRAYITGDQLSLIQLNQEVKVLIDAGEENYKTYSGIITWISPKAEFTPKTIQTKNERSNLVYAIKIKVMNDGYLKIGMYGEVDFENIEKSK